MGSEQISKIIVQIKNATDWNKGELNNVVIEDGKLKLKSSSTSTEGQSNQGGSTSSNQPKTINDSAIQLVQKVSSNGRCSALAPNDWAIVASDYGMDAGLGDPGLTTFASWSVPWSLKSMIQWSGHPELAEEENFLKVSLCTANFADSYGVGSLDSCGNGGDYKKINLGSAKGLVGGYASREYSLTNNAMKKDLQGLLIYKNFSAGDIVLYLMRMGSTLANEWENKGAVAVSSAITIRCTVDPSGAASGGTSSTGRREANDSEVTLSDKWQEAIMGYENVYDSRTGEHYTAPLNSYWETGPAGPGYYKQVGNDFFLLNRGFGG